MKTFELQIPVKPNSNTYTAFDVILKTCENNFDRGWLFTAKHHRIFYKFILNLSKGYSVLSELEGVWQNEKGTIYQEKMIPVRIACTDEQIKEIAEFAKTHYEQEAIFVLELGIARFF